MIFFLGTTHPPKTHLSTFLFLVSQYKTSHVFWFQKYFVSEERKKDQVDIDTHILDVIRKHPEKKLFGYLGALFSLKNRQYPHKMAFSIMFIAEDNKNTYNKGILVCVSFSENY